MKKIIDLANCDALITDIANALFEHDKECTRYDESIWVYVNEDDNTGKVIVSSRYDNHISDNYIFVTDMNGTSEDALDQYMAASDSPIADLAYLFDMEYDDLRKKASEEENVDLEDVDYHVVAEYIRNTPELLEKVEEEFRDWLQDVSEYRETAERLIDEQEKEADRYNEMESFDHDRYWGC